MSEQIHIRARKFLQQFFSDEELTNFCFDYFPLVYNDFTAGMPKSQKVRMVVENSQRRGRFDELLAALERERPKSYSEHFAEQPQQIDPKPKQAESIERNPRQIFISHSSQDADVAQKLAADLRAQGWQTWIAPDSIRPGEKWVEAINRGLAESGVLVLLLTREAAASTYVRDETNYAIELMRYGDTVRVIPIEIEPVSPADIPFTWSSLQRISLRENYEAGLTTLLHELDPLAHPLPTVAPPPVPPRRQPTRSADMPVEPRPKLPDKPLFAKVVERLKRLPTLVWVGGVGSLALILLIAFWPDGEVGVTPTPAQTITATTDEPVALVTHTPAVTTATATGTNETSTATPTGSPTPSRTPTTTSIPTPTPDPNVPPANAELGDTWTRPKDGMVMVYVPPPDAPFVLESGVDAPTEGFWIDKYEVSNAQYQLCVDAGVCEPAQFNDNVNFNGAEYPVAGVSAFDAGAYGAWVGGELPTEGQWEYAAVGNTGFTYPWGSEFDGRLMNCFDDDVNCNDGYEWTAPVDSFPEGVSWVGALNMSGNVYEWTASWYDEDETRRVHRGGSYSNAYIWAQVDAREHSIPGSRNGSLGFRMVVRPPSLDP